MKYAVTGAGGFVGGRLVRHLVSNGHEVVSVVRRPDAPGLPDDPGTSIRAADVTDVAALESAFEGCDGVFHLAALFNDPERSWDDYRAVNVEGTLNVLRAAKKLGIRRVVHCSTVGVATEAEPPPYSETTPYSPQPGDKYEVTKCEGEKAAIEYASGEGLSLAVVRPAQVYGPGDTSKAKFYKLVRKGVIVNPGKTQKHLIYVDDLCQSFLLAMEKPEADGEIFLIAGEGPILLSELVGVVARALDVPYPKFRIPALPVTLACAAVETACNALKVKPLIFRRSMDFFTRTVACDTTKSRRVLGFESGTPVEDGIRNTAEWYKEHGII